MLVRRHARRVVFPTTRFLQPTHAAAVRIRRPSDVGLLALRLAIVAAAVLACAQPVLLAAWRTASWDRRFARAVVVDTSASAAGSAEASRLADQEMQAFASGRFAGSDLRDELRRAANWIVHTPPARREVVIVSDFQRGALDAQAWRAIPDGVGIRFVRLARGSSSQPVTLPEVTGPRGRVWQPSMTVHDRAIDAQWTTGGAMTQPAWLSSSQPSAHADAAARALAAALSPGVPPGDETHRVIIAFRGAPPQAGERIVETPWMLRALLEMRTSELLADIGERLEAREANGTLIVRTSVAADDPAAPAIARAVVAAVRPSALVDPELEPLTIPDATLATWRRDPAPVAVAPGAIASDATEARWLWALALVLLGIEAIVRRRTAAAAASVEHARAA
jgi:hypothetical protein